MDVFRITFRMNVDGEARADPDVSVPDSAGFGAALVSP